MDLLQLPPLLEGLEKKVVIPHSWNDNKLKMSLHKYDLLSEHMHWLVVCFSNIKLTKHEFMVMCEAQQKSFAM